MPDHPPAPRRFQSALRNRLRILRHPLLWILALLLAFLGYAGWKVYDHRAAVREAQALGWDWNGTGTLELIWHEWRNAFKGTTWEDHPTSLTIGGTEDLTPYRNLLRRLHPEKIFLIDCGNMEALRGLDSIAILEIFDPRASLHLAVLKGLTGLRELAVDMARGLSNLNDVNQCPQLREIRLRYCPALENIGALSSLPKLRLVDIDSCPALQRLDALRNCSGLQELHIDGCPILENAKTLQSLTRLKVLRVSENIPDDILREIREVLPNTHVK